MRNYLSSLALLTVLAAACGSKEKSSSSEASPFKPEEKSALGVWDCDEFITLSVLSDKALINKGRQYSLYVKASHVSDDKVIFKVEDSIIGELKLDERTVSGLKLTINDTKKSYSCKRNEK